MRFFKLLKKWKWVKNMRKQTYTYAATDIESV